MYRQPGFKTRLLVLIAAAAVTPPVLAEGHGPVFALATPTLGEGGWSSDTIMMESRTDAGSSPTTLGQMIGYGLHEDLQFNLKLPLGRSGRQVGLGPNRRSGMMGAARDWEVQLMWRFQRRAPAVGTRRESTLHVSIAEPGPSQRRGLEVGRSLNAAIATGYASRSTYWWLSVGGQIYSEENGERPGDLYYAGAVFGYRPRAFRVDDAPLDLRWFGEAVAELPRADRRNGDAVPGTGGNRLLVGPSFLALGGPWGVSGGVLFPVHEDLGRREPKERYRAKLVVTYWF